MDEEILKKARGWTTDQFDRETAKEISTLIDEKDEKELIDRFYKDLEFGTGGMRGIMAAGINRMNVYTIGRATQGLCNYLLDHYSDAAERGICIAHDSRNNSRKFTEEAARVIAANGIKGSIGRMAGRSGGEGILARLVHGNVSGARPYCSASGR